MTNAVILLTGCINPNGMSHTVLQNPQIREQQYIKALSFYISNTNLKIVFVENTLYQLNIAEFTAKFHKRIEYITFNGNKYNKTLGKGYGEALIIEYALQHSLFIGKADCIIKITGRLIIKNIKQLIGQLHKESRHNIVICNHLNHLKDCPSEIIMANKQFYSIFIKNKVLINDSNGIAFEHILAETIKSCIEHGFTYRTYKYPIHLSGQSGSTGKIYQINPRGIHRFKCMIKYYKSILKIY